MGRPGVVTKPQIPRGPRYGPLHHLFKDLHDLHLSAGWPSLAKIAKGTSGLSKSTVSYVLSQPRLPDLDNLRAVVAALVELMPPPGYDMDETITHFVDRWTKAATAEASPPPSPRVEALVDTANGYLDLARAYSKAERLEEEPDSSPTALADQWALIAELSSRLRGRDHSDTVVAEECARRHGAPPSESAPGVPGGQQAGDLGDGLR